MLQLRSSSYFTQQVPGHSRTLFRTRAYSSVDVSNRGLVTYINRSVREDEHVEAPGSVVVHGDVAADASIEAGGDVLVWGRLSGHVHAGCSGDRSAVISALELRGAQLIIARTTSLAAARITVPGPHTASVSQVGRRLAMNLTPMGLSHPPPTLIGLTNSIQRWLAWYPAAAAALLTGCYALLAGLALLVAPKAVLGLLFDVTAVASGWIQLGGVLFATFGAQYLGTAIADYKLALAACTSSSGSPDMPFRPASPHAAAESFGNMPEAAAFNTAAAAAGIPTQAGRHATLNASVGSRSDNKANSSGSSVKPTDGTSSSTGQSSAGSTNGTNSSSRSSSSSSFSAGLLGRSVPADQVSQDQVQELRKAHKKRHKANATHSNSNSSGSSSSSGSDWQPPQPQLHQAEPHHSQQQVPPPTWLYCSAGFYEATVWSRLGLAIAFTFLVAVGACQPGLLVLAALNLFGALGMWVALRRQWLIHVMGDLPEAAAAYHPAS